ncbi:MAG: hypothetical protein IGBAC_0380 [Ignavibacteriae bacterium]|nr:MAG: hypothetical protein IGBAC_0380 [Ignavibacteriota bacterium]
MTEFSQIKRNTFYTTITISSRLFANVFLFWLLARFYGPEIFGKFTFAHTLATTFIAFADFGLEILLTTKLAANKGNKARIFEKLFGIKVILLILATTLMLLIGMNYNLSDDYFKLVLIFTVYLIFTSLNNFFVGVFKGYEKFVFEARTSLFANVFLIVLTVFLIILQRNIIEIAAVFALSRILGTSYSIYNLSKVDPLLTFKFDLSGLRLVGGKALIFGFHLIFSYLFFQVDTLLLAKLKGAYSVGIYQSVFKLVMLPLVIPEIFVNSLLPTLSRYFKENKDEWIKLGFFMEKILFILALPIAAFMIFYAHSIIQFAYGLDGYQDAVNVLRVFGIIILARFIFEPFALMLTTSDRQIIRLITVFIATILSITLNYFVIPKYDVLGASLVSLGVNTFVGVVYFISLKEKIKFWFLQIRQLIAIFFVFGIGYIFYKFVQLNLIAEIISLFVIYTTLAYKYYLTKNEKHIFHSLIRKFNFIGQ